MITYNNCVCIPLLEYLKGLFTVLYAEKGSSARVKEAEAYIHFVDFLDECYGKGCNNSN